MRELGSRLTISTVIMALALICAPAFAASDAEIARHIAERLGEEFEPESVTVTVSDSRAYAEMRGAVMSGIRLDTMRLDALLTNRDAPLSDDVRSLAALIGFSRGELVMLESDVNDYFNANDIRGFSGLRFDFTPGGFIADGMFSATMLFTIHIRLHATGNLALGSDGVYLENVEIYTEGIKQPSLIVDQVLSRVNPLIEWTRIPFKVQFREIKMDDEKAVMTGFPAPCDGATFEWRPSGARGSGEEREKGEE